MQSLTVRQLIGILDFCDQDAPVCVVDHAQGSEVFYVRTGSIVTSEHVSGKGAHDFVAINVNSDISI